MPTGGAVGYVLSHFYRSSLPHKEANGKISRAEGVQLTIRRNLVVPLDEFASVETETQAAALGVAIPARRTVAESAAFLAQPEHASLFYGSLKYAKPVQAPTNYAEVERILMRHLSQIMADEVKPQDGLKACAIAVTSFLLITLLTLLQLAGSRRWVHYT